MTSRIAATSLAFALFGTLAASAQTVDQLVANHALLNAELDRCKRLGMAANDDPRCRTAWTAENKRFFGGGTSYTGHPVQVYPNAPVPNITPPSPPRDEGSNGQ